MTARHAAEQDEQQLDPRADWIRQVLAGLPAPERWPENAALVVYSRWGPEAVFTDLNPGGPLALYLEALTRLAAYRDPAEAGLELKVLNVNPLMI